MSNLNTGGTVAVPSMHRRALITWIAVYPTITIALALIGPATAQLPLLVRTFVLTAIVVPCVVYVLVPMLTRITHAVSVGYRRRVPTTPASPRGRSTVR
ncbi:hypothetical protein [Nocardia sp. NBC_00511]|uniref:hypothetical protein n=1 Tax=Nocardia sp. NBC_00511 TaxID=2903591 RepID=UPI0030E3D1FE